MKSFKLNKEMMKTSQKFLNFRFLPIIIMSFIKIS